jgi:hypothetical protein
MRAQPAAGMISQAKRAFDTLVYVHGGANVSRGARLAPWIKKRQVHYTLVPLPTQALDGEQQPRGPRSLPRLEAHVPHKLVQRQRGLLHHVHRQTLRVTVLIPRNKPRLERLEILDEESGVLVLVLALRAAIAEHLVHDLDEAGEDSAQYRLEGVLRSSVRASVRDKRAR